MILIEIEPFPVVQPTPLKLKLCHINLDRSTQHGNIIIQYAQACRSYARQQNLPRIAAQTKINQKN